MKNLADLYKEHDGKVSDKWELYLREYDRLFAPYRDKPISMLEIGIQNGGSLEIWSKYFEKAECYVGCDINEDCKLLEYADPRISVVVGDATTSETKNRILGISRDFDLIIEDGSHTSRDIIKAFARYFPVVREGGIFVAEDLHCSYWNDFQGGLYDPYSSISFFKALADVVNYEHWGVEADVEKVVIGFAQKYGAYINADILKTIHSIEFLNSVVVVRKASADLNVLGRRRVVGTKELVVPGHIDISASYLETPLQSGNYWSILEKAPGEIHKFIVDENKRLKFEINRVECSISWRMTAPLRNFYRYVRKLQKTFEKVARKSSSSNLAKRIGIFISKNGGFLVLSKSILRICRRDGFRGLLSKLLVLVNGVPLDRNDYQKWIERYDTLDAKGLEEIRKDIESFQSKPKISVVMPVYNAPLKFLEEAVNSVRGQLYDNWELCIADDASTDLSIRPFLEALEKQDSRIKVVYRTDNGHISAASNSALAIATGDFVALLDNDDLLPAHALYHVAKAVLANTDAAIIYSDEDKISASGQRFGPYFKCEFNYELFLAQNMVSHLGVYRRDLLEKVGGFREGYEGSQDYDLALRVLECVKPVQIVHVPRVLYHWRAIPGSTALDVGEKSYAVDASRRSVKEHLLRSGRGGDVSPAPEALLHNRIRYPLTDDLPFVSIVIPTRDKSDLLSICLHSLLEKTTYSNYEVIIVDNGSVEEATLQLFERLPKNKVRVIYDGSPFNYSKLNNLAVKESRGDVICLMNNDIEIITPDWLEEMLSFANQPDIGCVGARLWFPNEQMQHGGVVLGIRGVAGHSHKFLRKGHTGYFGRGILHQSMSAVTGACLVVRRKVWDEVHGLDESLPVGFNDVDFCLRVKELGYRNIWTPYAEMYHHESASRGDENTFEKQMRFQNEVAIMKERWGEALLHDPAYSPNLTLDYQDFSFAWPPRV